jgi:sulfonate transport system permease protein
MMSGVTKTLLRRPTAAERDPARARRRRTLINRTLAVAFPVALILLWQIASSRGWIDNRLYPSPSDLVRDGRRRISSGELWHVTFVSGRRMVLGYAIGSAFGLALGIVMGLQVRVRATAEPLMWALYTVPKLALLPLFLTIFGYEEEPIVALVAVTVFFFVWISAMAAVMAVDTGYREAAVVAGAGKWQVFRHVIWPGALPQIFVGLRISAGVAILTLVGIEFVFGGDGLGFMINNSRVVFDPPGEYVGIVVVAILGLAFSILIRVFGRLASPWAKEDQAIGAI